jgi:hypothetical protein
MKGKAYFISILLFCVTCYGLLPDTTNATLLDTQPISIKDISGTEVGIYDESHALVIGGSDYTGGWPKLPGVEKDIILVKDALEAKGFNVVLVRNPDSQKLENAFEGFIEKYGYKSNNRLLFYFAGHGHTVNPKYGGKALGYIVPVEAPNQYDDQKKFRRVAMSMQRIEEYAMSIDAKHALFIFDSCFSGSLFALSRAVPEHISYKTAKPVRQFITSGGADEKVPDSSIFREQFIAALGGAGDLNDDGYMTGAELSDFIFKNVVNYSKGAQHPQYGKIRNPNLDKGDFVFRVAQIENKKTSLSDSSSLIELERQQLAEERERLEQVRRELEQLKLLATQRRELEAERLNIANQKEQLESKSPSESIKVEQNLDEVEGARTKLAKLGVSTTHGVKEIGRHEGFIAYEDGTVLDTRTNLMWWSKSIKKGVSSRSAAIFKSQNFNGGGYSDWRLPSIEELKTIYIKDVKSRHKTVEYITMTTSHLISINFGDQDDYYGQPYIKVLNFKNGSAEDGHFIFGHTYYSLLPVRYAN